MKHVFSSLISVSSKSLPFSSLESKITFSQIMRCFLPCFGSSKHSRSPNEGAQTHVAEGASQLTQQTTVAESKVRFQKQPNESAELIESLEPSREEQEKPTKEEETDRRGHGEYDDDDEANERLLREEEWSESLFSLSIESRKHGSAAEKAETEVNSPMQPPGPAKEESKGNRVESPEKKAEEKKANTSEGESSAKKLGENKYPEYRYRDCFNEGYEDMNLNGDALDVSLEEDNADHHNEKRGGESIDFNGTAWVQEESSESLFSLPTDYSRRPNISAAEKADNEVESSHVTDDDVSSVLNPIENVTQTPGMVAKATVQKTLNKKKTDKENIYSDSVVVLVQDHDVNVDVGMPLSPEHHSMKLSKCHSRRQKMMNGDDKEQEIRVDTSLSSWLEATTLISMKSNSSVGEQTSKGGRGSPWSNEDRPILGALTVEEIRMYSASTCSRRSRSKSPDETPIIGTVGSYWTHTGQIIKSNSSKTEKDTKLKSSSATLKTRLQTAFEAAVGEEG